MSTDCHYLAAGCPDVLTASPTQYQTLRAKLREQAKVNALCVLDCIFGLYHCGAHRALLQTEGFMRAE